MRPQTPERRRICAKMRGCVPSPEPQPRARTFPPGPRLSLDHKTIGLQYVVTSLTFLLIGFLLMVLMRWQLANPGQPVPLVGAWLGATNAPNGVISPEFYNSLGAMHGTIMIFLGVVPLAVGGFGNFLIPLQIGASDMAFPRLNMASYWIYLCAGLLMLAGFVTPDGPAPSGWTSIHRSRCSPRAARRSGSPACCW